MPPSRFTYRHLFAVYHPMIDFWRPGGQDTLARKGYLRMGTYSGWYSVPDEAFYTDAQVCALKGEGAVNAQTSAAQQQVYLLSL